MCWCRQLLFAELSCFLLQLKLRFSWFRVFLSVFWIHIRLHIQNVESMRSTWRAIHFLHFNLVIASLYQNMVYIFVMCLCLSNSLLLIGICSLSLFPHCHILSNCFEEWYWRSWDSKHLNSVIDSLIFQGKRKWISRNMLVFWMID